MAGPLDNRRAKELDPADAWLVSGIRDSSAFFERIGSLVEDATTLILEGDSIAPDVETFVIPYAELLAYEVPHGTLWPTSRQFRLRFDVALLSGLSSLAGLHAEPEICDHLHLYAINDPRLQWFDAFHGPFLLSKAVSITRLERFCRTLGGTFDESEQPGRSMTERPGT